MDARVASQTSSLHFRFCALLQRLVNVHGEHAWRLAKGSSTEEHHRSIFPLNRRRIRRNDAFHFWHRYYSSVFAKYEVMPIESPHVIRLYLRSLTAATGGSRFSYLPLTELFLLDNMAPTFVPGAYRCYMECSFSHGNGYVLLPKICPSPPVKDL